MANSLYTIGMQEALARDAITVYGKRPKEIGKIDDLFPLSEFRALPSLYHAVMTKAQGDFACLMVKPTLREVAEAEKFPNHRARAQTVSDRPYHPLMLPTFSLSPDTHSSDTLRDGDLLKKMSASTIEAVRQGIVKQWDGRLLLRADSLSQLPLTIEKSGRGSEAATAEQTTFLAPTEEPFLVHQHIGSLHDIPADRLSGPYPLIYLSGRTRMRDLIGTPLSAAEGTKRHEAFAKRMLSLLPEGGILLSLGQIDARLRHAFAACLAEGDVYMTASLPETDLIVKAGSDFAKDLHESFAGKKLPVRVYDTRSEFLRSRKKTEAKQGGLQEPAKGATQPVAAAPTAEAVVEKKPESPAQEGLK